MFTNSNSRTVPVTLHYSRLYDATTNEFNAQKLLVEEQKIEAGRELPSGCEHSNKCGFKRRAFKRSVNGEIKQQQQLQLVCRSVPFDAKPVRIKGQLWVMSEAAALRARMVATGGSRGHFRQS